MTGSRKVRAPQGTVPGNARAPRGDGKCHREQTADGGRLTPTAQARVKRWGKSPPRAPATAVARQTPPGARPSRSDGAARPVRAPGRPHEASGNRRPREMTSAGLARHRTRLTPLRTDSVETGGADRGPRQSSSSHATVSFTQSLPVSPNSVNRICRIGIAIRTSPASPPRTTTGCQGGWMARRGNDSTTADTT